ncbi:MAG TPA: alkaline phosphatase family protein [Aliidongia sp.]|nr:alkaline phosphatase family protein [Aliidongia sp.]
MAEKPSSDQASPLSSIDTSRRNVIKGVAGIAGAAALSSSMPRAFAQAAPAGLPLPADSGIDHIVVLMMENRSFDHMLGWLPGAAGKQAGRTFVDNQGASHDSFLLTKFQNCSSADPDHSFQGGRTQLNGGAMDGFLKTAPNGDTFPIGYYTPADVPFFANAARYWTICDHYFCSILGPTWPNRFYMHSGQTDRLTTGGPTIDTNSLLSILPTIWDLAAAANLPAHYYFSDSAFTALWGGKYSGISFPLTQFMADAAAGTLPAISYVDPGFSGEGQGTSNDDHPLADIRNGQVLMNKVYQALSTSPNWAKTLFIINYDEWGGFADHVVPPMGPVSAHEVTVGNVDTPVNADGTASAHLGFRVPCILIGPRARRGSVASGQYDANAILNMITWRFGLPGIGVRATTSGNIATALNFSSAPNVSLPPPVNLVSQVYGSACAANPMADLDYINKTFAEHYADLDKVQKLMVEHGFRTA